MKKNRFAAILCLACTLALSLSACGSSDRGSSTITQQTAGDAVSVPNLFSGSSNSTSGASSQVADTSDEEMNTAESTAEAEPEETGSGEDFTLSTKTADTYSSEFLNLRFVLPQGFSFFTDEQIAQLLSMTAEMLSDSSDVVAVLESGGIYFDMIAVDEAASQVQVAVQQFNALQTAYIATYSSEQMVDAQIEGFAEGLAQTGAVIEEQERQTVQFLGEEVPCAYVKCTLMGVDMYNRQVYIIKDNYLVAISVATMFSDETIDLLGTFTTLH